MDGSGGRSELGSHLDPDGAEKDRNSNGIVCRKVEDRDKTVGGPDDRLTDDILI